MGTVTKTRRKPGPPPHADGGYVVVPINVREKTRDSIDRVAQAAGQSRSQWMREAVLSAVRAYHG